MTDIYYTETRTIKGVDYRIEWLQDTDHGAPQYESDGHGVVFESPDTPEDMIELLHELEDEPNMEDVIRYKMMRELVRPTSRHEGLYYDVWETMKVAKRDGWGVANPTGLSPDEIIAKAIDIDYRYLRGWYTDEWHWCGITVIRLDAEGDDTHEESVWGYSSDDDEGHEDAIADLVSQIEYRVKKEAHKGQIPLPFETTTA